MPHSFRIVCGFFNVPRNCEHSIKACETGPTVYIAQRTEPPVRCVVLGVIYSTCVVCTKTVIHHGVGE